jgi:hypothetical protein
MTMRCLRRNCLVAMTTIVSLAGLAGLVAANTELTPAARLVAPFFDISSGIDTFLILTNASRSVHLDGTTFPCGPKGADTCGPFGVHLAFYGQSCERIDSSALLSPGDTDQLDLRVNPNLAVFVGSGQPLGPVKPSPDQSGFAGRGWVDIDVRFGESELSSAPSVQANVLLGTVLISNVASDFAVEYPMASSIGRSDSKGILGRIVRRDKAGRATDWNGRYEPFPWRVFVPTFFAEGTDATGPNAGTTFGAFLALAGPADGNWDHSDNGEAPGQQLGTPGTSGEPLIDGSAIAFDGCEQSVSASFTSHYVNNFLSLLIPAIPARTSWTAALCGVIFPGRDELSGQAIGWVDIQNRALACDSTTPGKGAGNCPAYSPKSQHTTFTGAGNGTGQRRGLVGMFIQSVLNPSIPLRQGVATRLWGDRRPWVHTHKGALQFPEFTLCRPGLGGSALSNCVYSFADLVSAEDMAPDGNLKTAVPSPGEFP